jgi:hypothetical protein
VKKSTTGVALGTLAGAIMAAGVLATPASAYTHRWECYQVSQKYCYDFTGQTYNPWKYVTGNFDRTVPNVCAGARGAGGNAKQGSSCSTNPNSLWSVTLTSSTPESQAYILQVGNPNSVGMTGVANTP